VREGGTLGEALAARGHEVIAPSSVMIDQFGGGQAIAREEDGTLTGAKGDGPTKGTEGLGDGAGAPSIRASGPVSERSAPARKSQSWSRSRVVTLVFSPRSVPLVGPSPLRAVTPRGVGSGTGRVLARSQARVSGGTNQSAARKPVCATRRARG
jgi:hypothetical protein